MLSRDLAGSGDHEVSKDARRVVVGVDGTLAAIRAARWAAAIR